MQLARDGTVSACRLAAAAELLVGTGGGNPKVACAAGAQVEFHRNGYLSFCNPSRRGRHLPHPQRPHAPSAARGARVAFDENGVSRILLLTPRGCSSRRA